MEKEPGGSGWIGGAILFAVATAAAAVSSIWNAITKDGTLAAAGRQGADELALALRAFPETIHVDEPGTILNPTQGEIAADRKPDRGFQPTHAKKASLPSPSEIAKDKQPYTPEKGHDHGREMGRG